MQVRQGVTLHSKQGYKQNLLAYPCHTCKAHLRFVTTCKAQAMPYKSKICQARHGLQLLAWIKDPITTYQVKQVGLQIFYMLYLPYLHTLAFGMGKQVSNRRFVCAILTLDTCLLTCKASRVTNLLRSKQHRCAKHIQICANMPYGQVLDTKLKICK